MDAPPPPLDYSRPTRPSPGSRVKRWVVVVAVGLTAGLVVIVFLPPSYTRSPAAAYRAQCAFNLRQIGAAIATYQLGHGGAYPDTLATLVAAEFDQSDGRLLVCPASADTPAAGPTTRAVAAAVAAGGHCSYTYVGRGLTAATVTATTVIAYEPLADHGGTGCNVLFGDGNVAWQTTLPTAGPVGR